MPTQKMWMLNRDELSFLLKREICGCGGPYDDAIHEEVDGMP